MSKRLVSLRWPGEDFGKLTWSLLIRAISYHGGVLNNYMHVEHRVLSEPKFGDYLMGSSMNPWLGTMIGMRLVSSLSPQ